MSESGDRTPQARAPDPAARLQRLARWAAVSALWESLWPPLAWAGSSIALFLAVSWFGLWFVSPSWVRAFGLFVLAAAIVVALRPLAGLRGLSRREALARLDRESGRTHGAASGFEDTLANTSDDPTTAALWSLHRARLAREIETLRVGAPAPGMAWRDPRALRYAALMLAFVGAIMAGSERYARVAAAFDWSLTAATTAPPRIDAWIDPPAYTGKPPLLLKVAGQLAPETIATPEDSMLVVRSEGSDVETSVEGAITAPPIAKGATPPPERRFALHGDGKARILRGGTTLATFLLKVTPSGQPTIALIGQPQRNASGSLTLRYSIHDAYGAASAEAEFKLPGETKPGHRLVEPPKLTLALPEGQSGLGDGATTSDLADNAWAGADVLMVLRATDVAGHVGESEAIPLKLPQRPFTQPLAKALVEQRRNLIVDPDRYRPHVARALDAFLLAPESFDTPAPVYLGLRMAQSNLAHAHSDKQLVEVADLLWAMALQIEDGDTSKTLQALRAAKQKLREALKKGASEDEIKALTQQLRALAEKYLSELAKREDSQGSEEQAADPRDIDEMMDRMAEAARNGSRAEAEAMLDQLQNLLENMQGPTDPKAQAAERELRKQLGEIEKLLRDQQALRDDTFKRGQSRPRGPGIPDFLGEPGDNSDERPPQGLNKNDSPHPFDKEGEEGSPSLQDRQQALRDRLAELQKKLKQLGLKGEKGFDDAEGDMKEAERDLRGEGQGSPGDGSGAPGGKGGQALNDAVQAQGRALEALRGGMQGLQKQMQGSGGPNGNRAVGRRDGRSPGKDPFGRDSGAPRGASEGSLHEGQAPAERARRVVEELRRRLADPNRAHEERDYLERLLGSP